MPATVTSKGRTMTQSMREVKSEEIVKTFRGAKKSVTKVTYECTFITDYGATIVTTATHCYPSWSFTLPGGNATANKWDLYEAYRK